MPILLYSYSKIMTLLLVQKRLFSLTFRLWQPVSKKKVRCFGQNVKVHDIFFFIFVHVKSLLHIVIEKAKAMNKKEIITSLPY